MITIKYAPKKRVLKMTGHAGFGEKGGDIVCAAASMIFLNLCAMLDEYDQELAFAEKPEIQSKPGRALVKVTPHTGYERWIDHDFLYALTGFRALMKKYPDYVNLIVTQN